MLIFFDKRIPEKARLKLAEYGKIIPFKTDNIVYEAISGHPDIFFCRVNDKVIIAPNLPDQYKIILTNENIFYIEGEEAVGYRFPKTARYNIVSTDKYLMHNFRYTDSRILENEGDLDTVQLNQGYSRCNLLPLKEDYFITSDEGIFRMLQNLNIISLYVDPGDIVLPGYKHGFFGGACGVYENKVFIIGSLNQYNDGDKVRGFLSDLNYEIIELYDGPLFDGGSLFIV